MRARTARLLSRACLLFPTAVISGRSRSDVAARLGSARVKHVVGNHGLEPTAGGRRAEASLDEARARLGSLVAATPGLDLEDKGLSLTVHFRRSRAKTAAQAAIRQAVGRLSARLRLIPGKCVINIVPGRGPNKGDAVVALRLKEKADLALYVGDDVTDEDVFCLDQPGRLLGVRIGHSATSAAAYFLRNQVEVDDLLRHLIAFREKSAR